MCEVHVDCLLAGLAGGLQDLVGGGDYRRLQEEAWQVRPLSCSQHSPSHARLLPVHYDLTGGWVPKFKALYLAYFLQCALTDYASGKA